MGLNLFKSLSYFKFTSRGGGGVRSQQLPLCLVVTTVIVPKGNGRTYSCLDSVLISLIM